eukprot:2220764-Pyramimonas_sp.AAC.1
MPVLRNECTLNSGVPARGFHLQSSRSYRGQSRPKSGRPPGSQGDPPTRPTAEPGSGWVD